MYLHYRKSWESGEAVNDDRRRRPSPRKETDQHSVTDLPFIELRGMKLHRVNERQCIDYILGAIDVGRGGVVVTPNLDHIRRYISNVYFRALVLEADLVVADGMPLVWASRLQGTPLPERVAGSNLISTLSGSASERGRSIFLLGGAPGAAEGAAAVLVKQFPKLKIAGTYCPPFGFENDNVQMASIAGMLSVAKPDIVFVGLGSPKQEIQIAKLKMNLQQAWWLGVGNSFSFLAGDVKRAPVFLQKMGMEWAHRLSQEPGRLFTRYVTSGMPFALSFLARSAAKGVANRAMRLIRRPSDPVSISPKRALIEPNPMPLETPAPVDGPKISLPPAVEAQFARAVWPNRSDSSRSDDAATTNVSRLRALILLGGSVRANALSTMAGRSVLDLPLDNSTSILNFWLAQAAETARAANLPELPVRVMVDQNSPEPRTADSRYIGVYCVERDQSEYRGTGGVLCDICNDYADDDYILVANAAQILLDPLPLILSTLQRKRSDVAVVAHEDGTPSGMMLLACKTLRLMPATGFFDMKEQGLPRIAAKFDVRAVKLRRPTGLPVRSLEGYVQALHYYHGRRSRKQAPVDPLAEDFTPSFSVVEAGSTVDGSAKIHDSVVLAGGVVEPGAVLVRSVVCPGAVVRRDRSVVDRLIIMDHGKRKRASRWHTVQPGA